MTKSPVLNALAAAVYIILIGLLMNFASTYFPKKDNFVTPMAVISLFTLSAAVMAYIFLYQPLQLFLTNKKEKAVKLFLQTVFVFAGITVVFFLILLSGVIK